MLKIQSFNLRLMGPFKLTSPNGRRVEISSKKGMAILAMLAMADGGEHSRSWLRSRLWGDREHALAGNSLRRELSGLRKKLNSKAAILLLEESGNIRLALELIQVDALVIHKRDLHPNLLKPLHMTPEFMEGIDILGAEGFEDWLRVQRTLIHEILVERSMSGKDLSFSKKS